MTESPNAPRPEDSLVRSVADALARAERNYDREGSGPGSRFEGKLLEDVLADLAVKMVRSQSVVHLIITDPEDPRQDDVFSACCGLNWRALMVTGMVTADNSRVTCPGRPFIVPRRMTR